MTHSVTMAAATTCSALLFILKFKMQLYVFMHKDLIYTNLKCMSFQFKILFEKYLVPVNLH